MDIKLTNGKKTIVRSKEQYEANINHFKARGFVPEKKIKKIIESTDKVVELKPKRKNVKKTKKKN
jgi:uncharacterized protein YlzI (FlbEa/FlbD family)|tara:strand:+ start:155 stop:349 length:195 start_codon:yes stop_codon:yes gene_type:complete